MVDAWFKCADFVYSLSQKKIIQLSIEYTTQQVYSEFR